MTTGRSSPANRHVAAIALTLAVNIVATAGAHRRDEYLQAARLAVDPDRVEIQLDLTPGIAIIDRVLGEIDPNGDGAIDGNEASSYSQGVLARVTLDIDGQPVELTKTGAQFPTVNAMRQGEGTIRIQAVGRLPRLATGDHRLTFRNTFRNDVGAYLANALVPTSLRVTAIDQQRDVDQRELIISYRLTDPLLTGTERWIAAAVLAVLLGAAGLAIYSARRRSTGSAPVAPRAD
jgi:hypothetical protein